MLCQMCNKNQATVHYTKIINGKVEELHLCEDCAMNNSEFGFDTTFSFHKLLTDLIDNFQEGVPKKQVSNIECPFCGLNYSEFRKTGKFGCAQCYETFEPNLNPLFRGIHGHDEHTGKVPRRANAAVATKREIEKLKRKLDELVAKEAFEEAAKVRDRIKELEKKFNGNEE
ncbi:UvrB/UvrC motif-containing protein [Schnuerera sp. xch1]|uniref:UvrB/UvrC motif-containing protein n=1 Tax=Schnuerera sp. xch1 TaxID=2874283 RepID=UPI001CBD7496|nr:UvrB/UvrC motif-containing protein [Schnuerera sp. xch1]MBZ2175200.1 UvrB/UvrC motif-containing protein [Schnuerera sp. xch1]